MKRLLKITALVLGSLVLLAVILGFLLPYLVNLSTVKDRVTRRLSRTLKAEVSVKTLRLRVFPRPGLSAEGVRIRGKIYLLTVDSLRLYPEVIPLLHRKVVIRDFSLQAPHLVLRLPRRKRPFSLRKILEKLPPLPALEARLSRGEVRVFREETPLLAFSDLSAEVATRPHQILLEAGGKASFLQEFHLKGRLHLRKLAAEGLLRLQHVDLSRWPFWKGFPLHPEKTDLSLDLAYTYEDSSLLVGFKGQAPCVRFRKAPELLFSCGVAEGELALRPGAWDLRVKNLVLREPELEGEIRLSRSSQAYVLSARLKKLNFTQMRGHLTRLFPENRGVKKFLGLVRGGVFSDLEFKSRSPKPSGLFRPENFILSARVKEGSAHLRRPALNLSGVTGTLTLVMGDLTFRGKARLPESAVSRAEVHVHLKDRTAPLSLRAEFSGEARELLATACSASRKVAHRLKGWSVRGPVSGTLLLSGTRARPRVELYLHPRRVELKSPLFPWSLTVSGGKFGLKGRRIYLAGAQVSGAPGNLRLTASLDFSRRPYRLQVREARGKLAFRVLRPLVVRYPSGKELLEKYRFSLQGLELVSLSYSGPLVGASFKKDLRVEARLDKGTFYLPSLALPLSFRNLPVSYRQETLSFGPGTIQALGSSLLLAGDKPLASPELSLEGSGTVSAGLMRHLYQRFGWPQRFYFKTPFRLKKLAFSRGGDGSWRLFLRGVSPDGAAVEAEVKKARGLLEIKGGKLNYRDKKLEFGLSRYPGEYDLALEGEISPEVLTAVFETNPGLKGYFKAHFQARIRPSRPLLSHFKGLLEGGDFILPVRGSPRILRFSVRGLGRVFRFDQLSVRIGDSDLLLSGRLEAAPKNFHFEGALRSRRLDIPALRTLYAPRSSRKKRFLLTGHLALDCDRVVLSPGREVQGLKGDLFLYPGAGKVVFSRARFCGLPLSGDYSYGRQKSLHLSIFEPAGDFARLLPCLSRKKEVIISGPFAFKADLYLRGKKSLFEEGKGTLRLESPSGKINRFGLLAKIFGFLSPIDIFRGQIPSLEEKGFPYQDLLVTGQLYGSRLHLQAVRLEGPGLRLFASGDIFLPEGRLDLVVLASPFKTVDTLISHIPVVGFVLTGRDKMLVSVPIGVKGSYHHPTILPLDPKAIGEGVFGLFKRVFQLPGRILVPK